MGSDMKKTDKRVIFWDFDGTLTVPGHLWSLNVLRALQKVWPDAPYTQDQMRQCVVNAGFTWHTPLEDHTKSVGEQFWIDLHEHFREEMEKLGIAPEIAKKAAYGVREEILRVENYTVQPDAKQVLQACRDMGYENRLLSNNYPELPELMEQLGLAEYFDDMVVSAIEGYDKPHPLLFDIALKRAGNPAVAYMVGDNPVADIVGGKAADMKTILVHNKKECPCDHFCETLSDILKILK